MEDTFAALVHRQIDAARDPRITGVVTARVRAIRDDGLYDLNYLSMGSDDDVSAPARLMMPMAGAHRGVWFRPEVDDEVVVAFEHGDVNRPLILGAMWNDPSPPPDTADTTPANNTCTIVTRSGHQLTFDDSPGRGRITFRSAGGRSIVVDDSLPGSVTISSGAGQSVRLDDATAGVEIDAVGPVTIRGAVITLQAASIGLAAANIGFGAAAGGGMSIAASPTGAAIRSPSLALQPQAADGTPGTGGLTVTPAGTVVTGSTVSITSSTGATTITSTGGTSIDGTVFGTHVHQVESVPGPTAGPVSPT